MQNIVSNPAKNTLINRVAKNINMYEFKTKLREDEQVAKVYLRKHSHHKKVTTQVLLLAISDFGFKYHLPKTYLDHFTKLSASKYDLSLKEAEKLVRTVSKIIKNMENF